MLTRVATVSVIVGLSGCLLVVDPEEHRQSSAGSGPGGGEGATSSGAASSTGPGPGAGGAGAGDAGAGGSGASGGTGGTGGADPCEGLDLDTNVNNCGTCGFICGDGECADGVCTTPASIPLNGTLRSVRVLGEQVFVVENYANPVPPQPQGHIRALSTSFAGPITNVGDVVNTVGTLQRGTEGGKKIYFAGQVSATIYACDDMGCVSEVLAPPAQQIQYMSAGGSTLYLLVSMGSGNYELGSLPINTTTGVPNAAGYVTIETQFAEPSAGMHEIQFVPDPDRLYFSSVRDNVTALPACIYTAPIGSLSPGAPAAACLSPTFGAAGFIAADDGTVYAQEGWALGTTDRRIWRIGAGGALQPFSGAFMPPPDPPPPYTFPTDGPRAIDKSHLYVRHEGQSELLALPLSVGGSVHTIPLSSPDAGGIDASHSKYVFYTSGTTLHRWPKLP